MYQVLVFQCLQNPLNYFCCSRLYVYLPKMRIRCSQSLLKLLLNREELTKWWMTVVPNKLKFFCVDPATPKFFKNAIKKKVELFVSLNFASKIVFYWSVRIWFLFWEWSSDATKCSSWICSFAISAQCKHYCNTINQTIINLILSLL